MSIQRDRPVERFLHPGKWGWAVEALFAEAALMNSSRNQARYFSEPLKPGNRRRTKPRAIAVGRAGQPDFVRARSEVVVCLDLWPATVPRGICPAKALSTNEKVAAGVLGSERCEQ